MKDIYKPPTQPLTQETHLHILGASRMILGKALQVNFCLPNLNTGTEVLALPQSVRISQSLDGPGFEIQYTTIADKPEEDKPNWHITVNPDRATMWFIDDLDEQVGRAIAEDLDSQLPNIE